MNNGTVKAAIRTVCAVVCCTFMLCVPPALASKQTSLADRFNAATIAAQPGTFKSLGRTVHQGGYVRTRFEVRGALNPIKFQSPGISGGCNGFDVYGGSFSYISGDEILDWLRAVTENAGALSTYLFLTYLQEQCSVCSEVMQTLYAMQDLINTTMGGSCEVATAMVGGMASLAPDGKQSPEWEQYKGNIMNAARRTSEGVSSSYNASKDAITGLMKAQTDPAKAIDEGYADAEMKARQAHGGNMLYWVLTDGGTPLLNSLREAAGADLTVEQAYTYLSYYVGNMLLHAEDTDNAGEGTPVATSWQYGRRMTIERLLKHDYVNDAVPMGNCNGAFSDANNFCFEPVDTTFCQGYLGGNCNLVSFQDHFSCMMTGISDSGAPCSSPGIINTLGSNDPATPDLDESSEEFRYLTSFTPNMPFGQMLMELKTSPGMMQAFYGCAKEKLAIEFAFSQITHALSMTLQTLPQLQGVQGSLVTRYRMTLEAEKTELNNEYLRLTENAKDRDCGVWSDLRDFKALMRENGVE